MIIIKTPREISLIEKAGKIVYKTHQHLKQYIKSGITTNELNKIAEEYIFQHDAKPSFKGYNGFPKAICTSINDEVVHGIPSDFKLKDGDIISIDIGVNYKGYHADSAWLIQYIKLAKRLGLFQSIPTILIWNRTNKRR